MVKEVIKVRTSITIDPNVLAEVRKKTETNVSQFVEDACRMLLETLKNEESRVHSD